MSKATKKQTDTLLQIRADDFGYEAIEQFRELCRKTGKKISAQFEDVMRVYSEYLESQKDSQK